MDAPTPDRISLADLTVVEWGRGIAPAYAGRILADFGAKVRRVRSSGPTPGDAAGAARAFLHSGKEEIPSGEGAAALASADIVVEDLSSEGAFDVAAAMRSNPRLVVASVSPFGLTGPYAGFRGSDLEVAFLSGLSHLTPRDIARPEGGDLPSPLKMPGSLVSFYAGASAAAAALAGLHSRGSGGSGSHIDISMLETLIPALRREIALFHYEGEVASRFMRVWRLAPYGVKPCRDGFVFLQVVEKYHWEGLVDMMGRPEWALDPRYLEPEYRFEQRRDIEARIAPWLLTQSKLDFAIEAQRRGVPFAPVNELGDLLRIPQLHHRGFFRAVIDGGRPSIVPGSPFKVRRPQGARAMATPCPAAAGRGPLSGLRVIDFGHVWAGPYCAALLADMGAEVIKVESAHRIDIHRRQGPYPERRPGINRSGVWNTQNRGKRSVALNLSTSAGRELAQRLVDIADVVIENFAPGVMARLGLDYDSLAARNPRLVMASLSAFGQDGPQKGYVGYGPSLDAWAGLDRMTAYRDGGPNALGGMFPDTSSAIHASAAILAGLHDRDRTGRGSYIDVSELEVSILLLGDLVAESLNGHPPPFPGNGDCAIHPQGCFRAAGDDEWIALSVPDERAWKGLTEVIGRKDWGTEPSLATAEGRRERATEVENAIAGWVREREPAAAMATLQASGVPAAMTHSARTLLSDPQMRARDFFQDVVHPEGGSQPLYGPIWRFAANPGGIRGPAPVLGADNNYVLGTLLGIPAAEIAELTAAKAAY